MRRKRRAGLIQKNMALIALLMVGRNLMSNLDVILNTLGTKFDKRKPGTLINYFSGAIQKLEEGDWENSLVKSGKFVEAIVKLLWVFAGKTLPRAKDFKAGVYAQKIIDQVSTTEIASEGVRLQIPRACIFLYDITSNRGGRHDSDEFNPNEMDAITASVICSWMLAELVRFCASNSLSPDEARKIVKSVIERHYPIFEEIDGRIYIDNGKHKSALQCALMILYKRFPERMTRSELAEAVKRHQYGKSALKFERLTPFVDSDNNGNILLRVAGRKRVEQILTN